MVAAAAVDSLWDDEAAWEFFWLLLLITWPDRKDDNGLGAVKLDRVEDESSAREANDFLGSIAQRIHWR